MKRFLFAMLILSALCAPAAAAEPMEYVIGVEDLYYRPYYYIEDGQYQGIARDILDAFAKDRGIVFKYRDLPINRLYKSFLDGSLDFKFPDNPYWKPELKEKLRILYSAPVVEFIDGVMVKPENLGRGVEHLKDLGIVLGFTPWSYQDLINSGQIRVHENGSFSGLLGQVIQGRIDGAYFNPVVARYQLENVLKQPGALVFDRDLPHIESAYTLSTLKHQDLIREFNEFLARNPYLLKN